MTGAPEGVVGRIRRLAESADQISGVPSEHWARELREVADQLERSLDRLTELSGAVAHDLRVVDRLMNDYVEPTEPH